jgi:hypothetical protein
MKCGQFEVGIFLPARHEIIIVRAVKFEDISEPGSFRVVRPGTRNDRVQMANVLYLECFDVHFG